MPRNKRAGKYARNAVSRAKTAAHVEHDDQNDFEGDSAQFIQSQNTRFLADHTGDSKDIFLRGVQLTFKPGADDLLVDADLKLFQGRRYGLVGRNGSGKSTLLRAISGGLLGVRNHVSIHHMRQDAAGDERSALQTVVDSDLRLVRLRAEEARLEALLAGDDESSGEDIADAAEKLTDVMAELELIEGEDAEARATDILVGLGFTRNEDKQLPTRPWVRTRTDLLSGGWRVRVSLASTLFCEPDLAILDEPTNHLSVKCIGFVAQALQAMKKTTVLFVSHNVSFLNEVATEIIFLDHRRKLLDYFPGNYRDFQQTVEENRRCHQAKYDKQEKMRATYLEQIQKAKQHAARTGDDKKLGLVASRKTRIEQGLVKRLGGVGGNRGGNGGKYKQSYDYYRVKEVPPLVFDPPISFRFEAPPDLPSDAVALVACDEVSFRYPDASKDQLVKVSLRVDAHSRVGILGENGSGKSTLLNLIADRLTPTKGRVNKAPHGKLAFFTQQAMDTLNMDVTAVDFVREKFNVQETDARKILGGFDLSGDVTHQVISTLSGGQRARVLLATIAHTRPHLLVLDEPSNHLDHDALEALTEALEKFTGAVLLVSHDVTLMSKVCNAFHIVRRNCLEPLGMTMEEYAEREYARSEAMIRRVFPDTK